MKIFTPTETRLRDFCYINLLPVGETVSMLSGSSLLDRIQYYFFVKKVKSLAEKFSNIIIYEKDFDVESILKKVNLNDSPWDNLLILISLREIIYFAKKENPSSTLDKASLIANSFVSEVIQKYKTNIQILRLDNEILKQQIIMELIQLELFCERKLGQYN